MDYETTLAELQRQADEERLATQPKPTVTIHISAGKAAYTLSKEALERLMANNIVSSSTEEGKKRNVYGNNRIAFFTSEGTLRMVVTSEEELPAVGETLKLTLKGLAKETAKRAVLPSIEAAIGPVKDGTVLYIGDVSASPAGSVCSLRLEENVSNNTGNPSPSLEETYEGESDLEDMNLDDLIEELDIPSETETVAEELLAMVEMDMTSHHDIEL